jgi:hypothetical protein
MIKTIFLSVVFSVIACYTKAQQKPAPVLVPPKLQSFWGATKGGELPLDFVLNVVDSAIWVLDDKKINYRLSRFMFVHRSKDKFEDDNGEIKTMFNVTSVTVKNSGYLPATWQKNLYEVIKKEDELLITDIIVRDKKGNYFKAPDVKIIIN